MYWSWIWPPQPTQLDSSCFSIPEKAKKIWQKKTIINLIYLKELVAVDLQTINIVGSERDLPWIREIFHFYLKLNKYTSFAIFIWLLLVVAVAVPLFQCLFEWTKVYKKRIEYIELLLLFIYWNSSLKRVSTSAKNPNRKYWNNPYVESLNV